MATLAQLETQIQKLQRRADALRERKSAEIIASIRALMQEYGLTTADLDQHRKTSTGKKRGRPLGSRNGVAKKGAVKPKMPPKYRDPATGLTWSGHARPPAWIKDAPDRSIYLIDGASNGAHGSAGASKKSAAARRGRTAGPLKAAGVKSKARSAQAKPSGMQEASA